jgi:RNA polymerase sigma-70 factor (ECF subfamily)
MTTIAGTTSLGNLSDTTSLPAVGLHDYEAAIIAELRSGSEEAYTALIREFHQPIYSLVHRVVSDPCDAADATQEVFLKVFRGIKHFHGESSLKTWIYRIAIYEASNRRRWWFRHKAREVPINDDDPNLALHAISTLGLVDKRESPFDNAAHEEVRTRVERELRKVAEPYRTTVILRDLEGMSYEDIAEVTRVSLGTVKSRLTRGRDALRRRLVPYIREAGKELGLEMPCEPQSAQISRARSKASLELPSIAAGMQVEVLR